ncbi:MAG: ABC transporter permease [Ilumatobacteraceae bacterium]
MAGYVVKRFLNAVVLIFIASTAGYFLASAALAPRGNFSGVNPPIPKETIDAILDRSNVNDEVPIVTRYVRWMGGVFSGDLGIDLDGQEVSADFARRIGTSMRLLLLGSILGTGLGVLTGVVSAVRQYRPFDRGFGILSYVLLSTPVFLLAILLKYGAISFNDAIGTQFFRTAGEYDSRELLEGWALMRSRLQHLILPTLSIALGSMAFYSRYQRNAMLDVLGSDHLRTARAKGLTRRQALVRHGLRVAISPMATFFAYSFGLLVAGAAFTETIYGWYGMGQWFVASIGKNEINNVAAIVTFTAVLVLISGFLADVVLAILDPRVRRS